MNNSKDMVNLIEDFNDESVTKDIEASKKIPHIIKMQLQLLDFVMQRLSIIDREESFRERIKEAIKEKIEANEVSVPQLITLLKNTNTDSTIAADSVFSLMRPSKEGVVSPLVDPKQNSESNDSVDFGKDLNASDSEAIHKLMRILQQAESIHKKLENDVDDGR